MAAAMIPFFYLEVRLTFAGVAIVVDELGVVEGLKRSWSITRTLWWATLGLQVAIGVVPLSTLFVPAPFDSILDCATNVLAQATLVLAYLRLAGTQPVDRSTVRQPPPIPAPAV
jgi:membrane-anchored glycerophosphoryl diester phosphodiesterase (GDPDase)